jgi:type IV pilus assembly protein PilW
MVTSGLKKRIDTAGPPATTTPGSTLSIGGVVSVEVNDYSGGTITLQNPLVSPASFPAGTPVYLLKCMTYQVISSPDANNVCGGTAPCLVQGEPAAINNCNVASSLCSPIVDGIEDLQLAYGCDGCNVTAPNPASADGVIDDQGAMNGTFDQADFLSNTNWTTAPLTPDKIRLVQVSIVARQTATEIGTGETVKAGTNSAVVVLPDHNHANDASYIANPAAYAQQRRRLLIHTVETRNLES